jgi:hypothetical protein
MQDQMGKAAVAALSAESVPVLRTHRPYFSAAFMRAENTRYCLRVNLARCSAQQNAQAERSTAVDVDIDSDATVAGKKKA